MLLDRLEIRLEIAFKFHQDALFEISLGVPSSLSLKFLRGFLSKTLPEIPSDIPVRDPSRGYPDNLFLKWYHFFISSGVPFGFFQESLLELDQEFFQEFFSVISAGDLPAIRPGVSSGFFILNFPRSFPGLSLDFFQISTKLLNAFPQQVFL